jgi:hypothetical protein
VTGERSSATGGWMETSRQNCGPGKSKYESKGHTMQGLNTLLHKMVAQ